MEDSYFVRADAIWDLSVPFSHELLSFHELRTRRLASRLVQRHWRNFRVRRFQRLIQRSALVIQRRWRLGRLRREERRAPSSFSLPAMHPPTMSVSAQTPLFEPSPPRVGLRVLAVTHGSTAARTGVRPGIYFGTPLELPVAGPDWQSLGVTCIGALGIEHAILICVDRGVDLMFYGPRYYPGQVINAAIISPHPMSDEHVGDFDAANALAAAGLAHASTPWTPALHAQAGPRDGLPCGLMGCGVLTALRPGGVRRPDGSPSVSMEARSHFQYCCIEHKLLAIGTEQEQRESLLLRLAAEEAANLGSTSAAFSSLQPPSGSPTRPSHASMPPAEPAPVTTLRIAVSRGMSMNPPSYAFYTEQLSRIVSTLVHRAALARFQSYETPGMGSLTLFQCLLHKLIKSRSSPSGGQPSLKVQMSGKLLLRCRTMMMEEPVSFHVPTFPLIGCTVAVFGVSSQEFNGQLGLCVAFSEPKKRYAINLYKDGPRWFKGANLVCINESWAPASHLMAITQPYPSWTPASNIAYPHLLEMQACITRDPSIPNEGLTGLCVELDSERRLFTFLLEAWNIQATLIQVPFGMLSNLREHAMQRVACFECDQPPRRCERCLVYTFCSMACSAKAGHTNGYSWYHAAECRALCRARQVSYAKPRAGCREVVNAFIRDSQPVPQDFLKVYDQRLKQLQYYTGEAGISLGRRFSKEPPPYLPPHEPKARYKTDGIMIAIRTPFAATEKLPCCPGPTLASWKATASVYHLRLFQQAMAHGSLMSWA